MGRIERAVRELARVEDDPDALYNLGLAQLYAGDFASSVNAFRRAFFANLYFPALVCEKPQDDSLPKSDDDGDESREHPTDAGTHPKGLDSEGAARDYVDRCGDLWFGRPVIQRFLEAVRRHPLVEADVARHLAHLKVLQDETLSAGDRARTEGENTTLRSADRLAATDRKIAADVLAQVFALPA
jgi:hypothetical protein